MSETIKGQVSTTHATRYLQQLCKHWSHKLEVSFDAGWGRIAFPNGTVTHLSAEPEALHVRIKSPDVATIDRMKGVVVEHLDRFAFREAPLPFVWHDAHTKG